MRILIGFARIRSVCESVRIANQFAGEAVYSRAICTISRSIANPGRIRANPFSLRIVANCESTTQCDSNTGGVRGGSGRYGAQQTSRVPRKAALPSVLWGSSESPRRTVRTIFFRFPRTSTWRNTGACPAILPYG